MKKAFITGITGMVGSHMTDYLYKKTNWKIHGLYRWDEKLDNINHHIKNINSERRISLHYGDLCDINSLIEIINKIKPDYVFHLAAQSFPKTSFIYPIQTLNVNIIGTANLLEAIKQANLKKTIIHVCSSSEVFGRVKKEDLPINEEVQFHPASPYAISKVGTDLLGRFYAEAYGMKTITTRMFTHTGPRRSDVFAESTFAKQIAMIEKGYQKPVVYVGNLSSMRTIADVRDACDAYYKLVTINPIPGEFYNIGGNYTCTVGDILQKLLSLSTKKNISIKIDKSRLRPIDADLQIPNTAKFKKHTGWKPQYSFNKTMSDLLSYWRKQVLQNGNVFLNR